MGSLLFLSDGFLYCDSQGKEDLLSSEQDITLESLKIVSAVGATFSNPGFNWSLHMYFWIPLHIEKHIIYVYVLA